MYYVPGFSNYLNGLVPREELLSEDMPAYDAPVYYTPPRPQPVAAEPYYGEPSYYAEPSYSLPTEQPVIAEPYYEAPSYSLPTAQPVYSEPFLGGLSAPTLSEQPVSEAQPYSYTPAPGDPDWSTMTGWDWQSFLNQGKGGVDNTDAVNKWIAEQAAQGREYVYDPNKDLAYSIAMNSAVPLMSNLGGPTYSNFDPNNPAASMAQIIRFDKEGTNSLNAPVAYRSGENYILTDGKSENVLGRAASAEELQQLVKLADAQKYGWNLYRGNEKGEYTPGAQLFGKSDPRIGGVLGAIMNYAIPAIAGIASGGLSLLPQMGVTAGTTALGRLATGHNLGDALKYGAISGATTGLLSGTPVGDVLGDAVGKIPGVGDAFQAVGSGVQNAFAGNAAKAAADAAANEIVVTGLRNALTPAASSVLNNIASGGLAASMAPSLFTSPTTGEMSLAKPTQPPAEQPVGGLEMGAPNDIVVSGIPRAVTDVATGALSAAVPSIVTNPVTGEMSLAQPTQPPAEQPPSQSEVANPNDIVVTGIPRAVTDVATGALSAVTPTLTQGPEPRRPDYGDKVEEEPGTTVVGQKPTDLPVVPPYNFNADFDNTFFPGTDGIVVEAKKPEEPINIATLPTPSLPSSSLNTSTITEPSTVQPEGQPQKSTLDTVTDYLSLAGKLAPLFGLLSGGGNSSASNFRVPGGMGALHPSFGGSLPTPNIPGLGGAGGGPRTAADLGQQGLSSPQDYYRYGYGPEQSFFGYVPQGAPNTSKAYTGYAKGGFAVEGPGDGREDKIPAMLSDGEYVMDAETVALLGNGSNKAGADMLDKFRVKVRKHKGRELARGKFSKNAKRPEQYLAGGRA